MEQIIRLIWGVGVRARMVYRVRQGTFWMCMLPYGVEVIGKTATRLEIWGTWGLIVG